jgi:hypothetical protein
MSHTYNPSYFGIRLGGLQVKVIPGKKFVRLCLNKYKAGGGGGKLSWTRRGSRRIVVHAHLGISARPYLKNN